MITIIILLIFTILCFWLGIRVFKIPFLKGLFTVLGSLSAIVLILLGLVLYVLEFKKADVAQSESPDGNYKLILQSVGEPLFFGPSSGQIVLKQGKATVQKYSITVYDDGGCLREQNWDVTWNKDYVEIIMSGEEQFDEQIKLYYDGKSDSRQLETGYDESPGE